MKALLTTTTCLLLAFIVQTDAQARRNVAQQCRIVPSPGRCRDADKRQMWSYSAKIGACTTLFGCYGIRDRNVFMTRNGCERNCFITNNNDPSINSYLDCQVNPSPGLCQDNQRRTYYSYSSKTGSCVQITGCYSLSDRNIFLEREGCRRNCVLNRPTGTALPTIIPGVAQTLPSVTDRVTALPAEVGYGIATECRINPSSGVCMQSQKRNFYTFSSKTGSCVQIYGCYSVRDRNVFLSRDACRSNCIIRNTTGTTPEWQRESQCYINPSPGRCNAGERHTMWTFSSKTNNCQQIYGCYSIRDRNVFRTLNNCQQKCVGTEAVTLPSVDLNIKIALECRINPSPGVCLDRDKKTFFSYSSKTGDCDEIYGCYSVRDRNVYVTRSGCRRSCFLSEGSTESGVMESQCYIVPSQGVCRNDERRTYHTFSTKTNTCVRITGCYGIRDRNVFLTRTGCIQACSGTAITRPVTPSVDFGAVDIVPLPDNANYRIAPECRINPSPGVCRESQQRQYFTYSSKTSSCVRIYGCYNLRDRNVFIRRDGCRRTCFISSSVTTTPGMDAECYINPAPGRCRDSEKRSYWSYSSKTMSCIRLYGCYSIRDRNVFLVRTNCERSCSPGAPPPTSTMPPIPIKDVNAECRINPSPGRCREQDRRTYYTYSSKTHRCTGIYGCYSLRDRNVFLTREQCNRGCFNNDNQPGRDRQCLVNPSPGNCAPSQRRTYYSFSSKTSSCVQIYGCYSGRDRNVFFTREGCRRRCAIPIIDPPIDINAQTKTGGNLVDVRNTGNNIDVTNMLDIRNERPTNMVDVRNPGGGTSMTDIRTGNGGTANFVDVRRNGATNMVDVRNGGGMVDIRGNQGTNMVDIRGSSGVLDTANQRTNMVDVRNSNAASTNRGGGLTMVDIRNGRTKGMVDVRNNGQSNMVDVRNRQTGSGMVDIRGGQTGSSITDIRGGQTGSGMVDVRGGQTGSGMVDVRGGQTGSGMVDVRGGQTGSSMIDIRGGQTGSGMVDVRGGQTGSGMVDVRGGQTSSGMIDVRGGQTSSGMVDIRGGQTGIGMVDIRAGQTGSGMVDIRGGQTGPEMIDIRAGQAGSGMVDIRGGQSGSGMVDVRTGQTGSGMVDIRGGQTGSGMVDVRTGQTGSGMVDIRGGQTGSGMVDVRTGQTGSGMVDIRGGQTGSGMVGIQGGQTSSGMVDIRGGQTGSGMIDIRSGQTGAGMVDIRGGQTGPGMVDIRGGQNGAGMVDIRGGQTGPGMIDIRGGQSGSGMVDIRGGQAGSGMIDIGGGQTGSGMIDIRGGQTGAGMVDIRGGQTGSGMVDIRGGQNGAGMVDIRGGQTGPGMIDIRGGQSGSGMVDIRGGQAGSGMIDIGGGQTGSGMIDIRGGQTGAGMVDIRGGQTGPGMVDIRGGQTGPGMIDIRGGQIGSGMVDIRGGQTGPGMIDIRGGQSGSGMVDIRGGQSGSGMVDIRGGQTGPGMVDIRGGQTGDGMVDIRGGQIGSGMIDIRGGQTGAGMVDIRGGQTGPEMVDIRGVQTGPGMVDIRGDGQTMVDIRNDVASGTTVTRPRVDSLDPQSLTDLPIINVEPGIRIARECLINPTPGFCLENQRKSFWTFSTKTNSCTRIMGCFDIHDRNTWLTLDGCKRNCFKNDSATDENSGILPLECQLNPTPGRCLPSDEHTVWVYNTKLGACTQITGCYDYHDRNVWSSRSRCRTKCNVNATIVAPDLPYNVEGLRVHPECHINPSPGRCLENQQKTFWTFSSKTSACTRITGCYNIRDRNTWRSRSECRDSCYVNASDISFAKPLECKLIPSPGRCLDSQKKSVYTYSDKLGVCVEITGCYDFHDRNVWRTVEACNERCHVNVSSIPDLSMYDVAQECRLNPTAGRCLESQKRSFYTFSQKAGGCVEIYGCYTVNDRNVWFTRSGCRRSCLIPKNGQGPAPNVARTCLRPPMQRECRPNQQREVWYSYDINTGACEQIRGCYRLGDQNVFRNRRHCETSCFNQLPEYSVGGITRECRLNPTPGVCHESERRTYWSYSQKTGTCVELTGCYTIRDRNVWLSREMCRNNCFNREVVPRSNIVPNFLFDGSSSNNGAEANGVRRGRRGRIITRNMNRNLPRRNEVREVLGTNDVQSRDTMVTETGNSVNQVSDKSFTGTGNSAVSASNADLTAQGVEAAPATTDQRTEVVVSDVIVTKVDTFDVTIDNPAAMQPGQNVQTGPVVDPGITARRMPSSKVVENLFMLNAVE